jgi:(E)-4-hydroxy-3-methylbut-2-enyl-diphosphate synthase
MKPYTTRENTKQLMVKDVQLGQQNRIVIQSMTNTPTKDIQATIKQIQALTDVGCEIVRVAITDFEDAFALSKIIPNVTIPVVADIHFDYRLALAAIDHGIAKIRLNPGNISNQEHIAAVVNHCKAHNIPIRVGINSGSLPMHLLKKYSKPCPEAMIEAANEHIKILESLNFNDIVLSFKSSDVLLTIQVYRLAAKTYSYPLHIGVTEAGTKFHSAIKSSAALGALIADGIGDTIRISIAGDPIDEILVAKQLLRSFDLIDNVVNLVACPTCGRLAYDMIPIVEEVEKFIATIHANITVAVMGCAVNGPQEASRADIGIAGGKNEALLFRKGVLIRKVPQEQLLEELKREILQMIHQ